MFFSALVYAQKTYQSAAIGFYNTENLFDIYKSDDVVNKKYPFTSEYYKVSMPEDSAIALVDAHKASADSAAYEMYVSYQIINDEFTPEGIKRYTKDRYNIKLQNLSKVIAQLGSSITHTAPVVVGLAEVENRQVVQDLINQPALKSYNYGIVHYNSFDARGIDVALIYQKSRFTVLDSQRYIVELPKEEDGYAEKTRDILRVSGLLDGERFTFIVNHWPSRRGGEKASEAKREAAAAVLKKVFDEVKAKNPNEKIVAMGDLNDDPINDSVKKVVGAKGDENNINNTDIFSPMESLYKKGFGSLAYRDSWNLFDIILLSGNLIGKKDLSTYKYYKTEIYTMNGQLLAKEGAFKGYPRRTYAGDLFDEHGVSDHFPVYSVLIREVNSVN